MLKLISNKIRCKFCGDVIESFSVHDFKRCRCGKCSTDGGLEYAQRSFPTEFPEDAYEDLSIYRDEETGALVYAKDADVKDIRKVIEEQSDEPKKPIINMPKWGTLKYVTKDGRLTEEGKKRYFGT